MTTILQARDELDAALVAGGVAVAGAPGKATPPYAVIFGDGVDVGGIGRGQAAAAFRVTLLAGAWDSETAGRTLTGMVQAALAAIRSLPGWGVGNVIRDNVISVAGGQLLGADLTASRMVDI